MPLPLIAIPAFLTGTSAAANMWLMNTGIPLCAAGVTAAGKYTYDNFYTPNLPTFQHEAEVVVNSALLEVRNLASETREKLVLDEELACDERARMDGALNHMGSDLDTMASYHNALADVIPTLSHQHEPNHELMQSISEEQEQQRADIQEIKNSLEEQLPRLIRANQEKQELLTEIHQLKVTNQALEGSVLALSAGLNDALACVEEGQVENDLLRKQLRAYEEEKQNAKSSFSFSLFQS